MKKIYMYLIGHNNFSIKEEQNIFKIKKHFLNNKKNAQIIQAPKTSESNNLTMTTFIYKGKKPKKMLTAKNIVIKKIELLSDSLFLEPLKGEVTEKILFNNSHSISPYNGGWFNNLITYTNKLSKGEHRVQFIGENIFAPGSLSFGSLLLTYLNKIEPLKNFIISQTYDTKNKKYISSIWLTKK